MKIKNLKKKKFHGLPGVLSKSLRAALGMPHGLNVPPPWLLNMQRYGPPKSYPNIKLPGVNAPLPEGSQYGFHSGGWGQPPLDLNGKPLWGGDVFGGEQNPNGITGNPATMGKQKSQLEQYIESFNRVKCWGKMDERVYSDDDEEDELDGTSADKNDDDGDAMMINS